MNYDLIIVDDETIMLEGLTQFINWKELGFNVKQSFSNGESALEYLKNEKVDVVLTDIQMDHVSGIDIAEFIHEHKLKVKVIFLSAYKEFEYARKAIKFKVVHYLLKPIQIDEVKTVFKGIRDELDRETNAALMEEKRRDRLYRIENLATNQFLKDLSEGALTEQANIESIINLLNLNIDIGKSVCSVYELNLVKADNAEDAQGNSINDSIMNFIESLSDKDFYLYPLSFIDTKISIIVVSGPEINTDIYDERIVVYLEKLTAKIKMIFGLDGVFERVSLHENIIEYSRAVSSNNAYRVKRSSINTVRKDLDKYNNLFLTHIKAGNINGILALFDEFTTYLKTLSMEEVKPKLIYFIGLLSQKMEENNISYSEIKYNAILESNDLDEIIGNLKEVLNEVNELFINSRVPFEKSIIEKAKQYINENYHKDISLENISEHVYLSPGYFSRLFKNITGINYIDLLIRVRIEKAMDLLKDPQYTVYETGFKVGYKNTKYFYKIFKKYTGYTPSEYRKKSIN